MSAERYIDRAETIVSNYCYFRKRGTPQEEALELQKGLIASFGYNVEQEVWRKAWVHWQKQVDELKAKSEILKKDAEILDYLGEPGRFSERAANVLRELGRRPDLGIRAAASAAMAHDAERAA